MLNFFLITLSLVGLSFSQPIFDLLSKTPEFLVIRRASNLEMTSMAIILTFTLPILLSAIRWPLTFVWTPIIKTYDFIIYSALGFLLILLSTHNIYISGVAALFLALIIFKSASFQKFLRFISLSAPLFLIYFLFQVATGSFALTSNSASTTSQIVDKTKAKPTFVIIFDEFPLYVLLNSKDQINTARYPGFAQLAKNSVWFKNVSVATSWTERAVPSILSGTFPNVNKRQLPSLRDYPNNVFTLFASSHKVFGYEQVTSLCPASVCPEIVSKDPFSERLYTLLEDLTVIYLHRLLPTEYRESLPSIDGKFERFITHGPRKKKHNHKGMVMKDNRGDDVEFFRLFLKNIKEETPKLLANNIAPLYVIHVTFPHVPYRYLPDGRKYFLDRDIGNSQEFVTKWEESANGTSATALQRLAMQVGTVDKLIGEFIETLSSINILDKSSFVVTADHGGSFIPGEFGRKITPKNYADIMSVPLFISFPGTKLNGTVNTENVYSADVLPTILDINGIYTTDSKLVGQTLNNGTKIDRNVKIFYPLDGSKEILEFPATLDRSSSTKRYVELFGEGGFDARFYNGTFLIKAPLGKSLSEISEQTNKEVNVAIHNLAKYKNLGPSKAYHPSVITGFVRAKKGQSLEAKRYNIAVAVSDKTVAIAQSELPKKGIATFIAVLPPDSIVTGANKISAVVLK